MFLNLTPFPFSSPKDSKILAPKGTKKVKKSQSGAKIKTIRMGYTSKTKVDGLQST